MSLLMEALKKAEEAKRQAAGDSLETPASNSPPELTLKPLNPASPASPLPDLASHSAAVDADLATVPTQAPARKTSPSPSRPAGATSREEAERAAVRNTFSVKQPARRRTGLWLFLGLGIITASAIGAYFWWQLDSMSGSSLARSPQTQTVRTTTPPPPAPLPPEIPQALQVSPTSGQPASPVAAPEILARPTPARARNPEAESDSPRSGRPLQVTRSRQSPERPLEDAHTALQAGRFDEAQRTYEQVLRSDSRNTDALLGLATLAATRGQTDLAQTYYQRALESDPNDPTAQAGVISTRGQVDPGLSESRLKSALAMQPESPALHFALGNLYSRQGRWSDAQQAFFNAYSVEPDNPDFLFNLAVSLDHLRQIRLATQYYQMALNAAATRGAAFDRNLVRNRLLELQP